jgi:hypothetical protein
VVPVSVQRQARIKPGDAVEFKAAPGVITIVSKPLVADDEYTPEQRRIVDAQLAAAGEGPFYGPFDTADHAIEFLRREIRVRRKKKPSAG